MTNGRYDEWLERKRAEFGDRLDTATLEAAAEFIPYFRSGDRIKVRTGDFERTGTVGITTGWRPAFLLIHRSNARGSWDVLGSADRIVAVKRGRTYVPVKAVDA